MAVPGSDLLSLRGGGGANHRACASLAPMLEQIENKGKSASSSAGSPGLKVNVVAGPPVPKRPMRRHVDKRELFVSALAERGRRGHRPRLQEGAYEAALARARMAWCKTPPDGCGCLRA